MNLVFAAAAVSLFAGGAFAQTVSLSFSADSTLIDIGDTVNWTVSATFSGVAPSGYFGGFGPGVFAASDPSLGTAFNEANLLAFSSGAPATTGADVGVNVFQSRILTSSLDQSNPITFFTFSVVADSAGVLSYGAEGTASLFEDDGIFANVFEFDDAPVTSDSVTIIPAPGVVAFLGVAGVGLSRRRR